MVSDSQFKDLRQGSTYSFSLIDESVQGTFVNQDKDFVFIKLKSGYNQGVSKQKIKDFKLLLEKKETPAKKAIIHKASSKGKILILHTGGTIASKVDYSTGAVNAKFSPEELLALFPELSNYGEIDSKLVSNMPSDDMNFSHYNILGQHIFDAVSKEKNLKGIILTHGTDTLHYTSAALSFMLQGLSIPVVVVGSQRSSDRPSSDAYFNLLNAAYFIKNGDCKGVFVCMHKNENDPDCLILNGVNVRKMHSSRRDAFKPVNNEPVAQVNCVKNELNLINPFTKNLDVFQFKKFNEKIRVGIIKSRPGLYPEEFKLYRDFDGLILEGTGLGHFPITKFDVNTAVNEQILEEIKTLSKKVVLAMTSQTIYGRVNLNVYSPGRVLKNLGVLGHESCMSVETAYIKLAWLLSNYEKQKVKELYSQDLVGELVERISS